MSVFIHAGFIRGLVSTYLNVRLSTVPAFLTAVVISALTIPYQAHALSVLYYRFMDPQRPAIDPTLRQA